MKRYLTLITLLSCTLFGTVSARILPDSVYTRQETLLSRIYFPTEIGLCATPGSDINTNVFWRTSLEYRMHAIGGWFFTIEYNDHKHTYHNRHFEGSNASEGNNDQFDILGGGGFRLPLSQHWRVAGLVQGGLTRNHLTYVSTADDGTYQLKDVTSCVPSAKATAFIEYYIVDDVALYVDAGYTHHLKPLVTERYHRAGIISLSFGITWCLY